MHYFFAPLGLAMLLAYPACAAQPAAVAAPLTLDAALGLALEHNPALRAAAHGVHIAAGQRVQAAALPNPEVSLLAEGLQKEGRTTTVMVSQLIELGGKRGARIAAAELDGAAAAAELAAARSKLRAEVMAAFFDVLAAQERMTLAAASSELARRASAAASRRVAAGRISPVEETRARVAEANSKIELSQSGSELEAARRQLAAAWGGGAPSFGAVEAPSAAVPARPAGAELGAMLAQAPQLVLARIEVERQQARADLERRRQLPDLTLSLGSKRDEQFGQRQTVVGVSLPLPLFDRNQGNIASALRRTDHARDELAAIENRLALEVSQAWLRLDASEAQLEIIRSEILPAAQSAYDASAKGFELGKFGFLDVLDAQRTLFQARAQYVRSLAELHRAGADIERLLGRSAYQLPSAPTS